MARLIISIVACVYLMSYVALQRAPSASDAQISQLMATLPRESALRLAWEAGSRGDGVHFPWMDKMKHQGVRRAWVVVVGGITKDPNRLAVDHTTYYSGYQGGSSEILDASWIERIRESGLAADLEKVALERAPSSPWYQHDSTRIPIDLLDDAQLPPTDYSWVQMHLASIASALDPKSELYRELKRGFHGDGTDHRWTDQMRREGVKRATVTLDIVFDQDGKPRTMKVLRTRYFRRYESDLGEITQWRLLDQIAANGLLARLKSAALQLGADGAWVDIPKPPPDPFVGRAEVEFCDDSWLPCYEPPLFTTNLSEH